MASDEETLSARSPTAASEGGKSTITAASPASSPVVSTVERIVTDEETSYDTATSPKAVDLSGHFTSSVSGSLPVPGGGATSDRDLSESSALGSETRDSEEMDSGIERDADFTPAVIPEIDHSDAVLGVSIDRFGFPVEDEEIGRRKGETKEQMRLRMRLELTRTKKWQKMLYSSKEGKMHELSSSDMVTAQIAQWNAVKNHRKMKTRIRKGIPQALRGTVWQNLCGARERRLEECSRYGSTRLYRDLVDDERSPHHAQIWKDINRTYRKQVRFGAIGLASSSGASAMSTSGGTKSKTRSSTLTTSAVSSSGGSSGTLPPLVESVTSPTVGPDEMKDEEDEDEEEKTVEPTPKDSVPAAVSTSVDSSYPSTAIKTASGLEVKHRVQDTSIPPSELYKHATEAQMQLYNVLKAFSVFRSDIGYCQGMGGICALMLMFMTEEDCFWVLCQLAEDVRYGMEWLWRPDMPAIPLRFYQMQRVVRMKSGKLAKKFEEAGIIDPSMYQASQWFITGFLATEMRFECLVRVWDIYLSEGMKSIFRFGLGILKYFENELLQCEMEDMITLFREGPAMMDTQKYIDLCLNIKITHSQLAALERQFQAHAKKEGIYR